MYVPRARPVNRDLSVSMTRCWHSSYCLADVESFDVVIDLGICAHEQREDPGYTVKTRHEHCNTEVNNAPRSAANTPLRSGVAVCVDGSSE